MIVKVYHLQVVLFHQTVPLQVSLQVVHHLLLNQVQMGLLLQQQIQVGMVIIAKTTLVGLTLMLVVFIQEQHQIVMIGGYMYMKQIQQDGFSLFLMGDFYIYISWIIVRMILDMNLPGMK